jgi:Putative peptidoglycan binding domain
MSRRDLSMARYGDWETEATSIAQRLLNEAVKSYKFAYPLIDIDGKFGDQTDKAVRAFQKQSRTLAVDGIVGPLTFARLGLSEGCRYPILLRGQRDTASCWSTCTAMLNHGIAPKPVQAIVMKDGGLLASSDNMRLYAADLHWRFHQAPLSAGAFAGLITRVPLWVTGAVVGHASGLSFHTIVFGGVLQYPYNGQLMTAVKVFDPWPPGTGKIYLADRAQPEIENASGFDARWILEPQVFVP